MIVEPIRQGNTRSFAVRKDDGNHVRLLTFRHVEALVATRVGRTRARWHRSYGWFTSSARLEAECDVYGIGWGTLWDLQRDDFTFSPLITQPDDEGPIALTSLGEEILGLILAMPGVDLPPSLEATTDRAVLA